MSEGVPAHEPQHSSGDTEEVDALPVPLEAAPLQRPQPAGRLVALRAAPAVQAAAVAAGGFVAGAAVTSLARRRRETRALPRRGRSIGRRAGEPLRILGSRSLLLDVHLLDSGR